MYVYTYTCTQLLYTSTHKRVCISVCIDVYTYTLSDNVIYTYVICTVYTVTNLLINLSINVSCCTYLTHVPTRYLIGM